jgi:hypothetical protein
MKPMIKSSITLFFLFIVWAGISQNNNFQYQRSILGATDQWHRISLLDEMFGHLSYHLSDIRIYGITAAQDTVEVPYLLEEQKSTFSDQVVNIKIINETRSDKGFHYTFQLPPNKEINHIALNIGQHNYDWRINLEGSENQEDWFVISENYRILSIKNRSTDYTFNDLVFPVCNFRYLRLTIPSPIKPELNSARISLKKEAPGVLKSYNIVAFDVKEDDTNKKTIIDLDMAQPFPVSEFQINISDQVDYYRPMTIQYAGDSMKTGSGWTHQYRIISTQTLNNIDGNKFSIPTTRAKKFRFIIDYDDNQPLNIQDIEVFGYRHDLVVRLPEAESYFMLYGKNDAAEPRYDLGHFKKAIPADLKLLQLGPEHSLGDLSPSPRGPLFKNKLWLYLVMVIIVATLGWFTMKMMRKERV